MKTFGARRARRALYPALLTAPIPDLTIDFASGRGIPVAHGGAGGRGSELVTITSSQSGPGFYRRRAAAYDPAWQGYPLFEPKPADRLFGWPGPRTNGYWTGGGYWYTSTSETVAVYASQSGLTVTTVAGGVIGPDAIRCDVAAGQNGANWHVTPVPVLTSGWIDGDGYTVVIAHAVVEVMDQLDAWEPRLVLHDAGAGVDRDAIVHRFGSPATQRSATYARGIGPHGGQLYEWHGIARLLAPPVGPLHGRLYLLRTHGPTPARTMIVHGAQVYIPTRWDHWPVYWPVPFFSYARGAAVSWLPDILRITMTAPTYTIALSAMVPALHHGGLPRNYGLMGAINTRWEECYYEFEATKFRTDWPMYLSAAGTFQRRAVCGVDNAYRRWLTLDGVDIVDGGVLSSPSVPRSYVEIGQNSIGEYRQVMLWRRLLTNGEMRAAFQALRER